VKAPVAPGLRDLADRLSNALETRVKVELGQRKGKIVVEFATLDDLERIVRAMSPGPTAPHRAERPLPSAGQP
jgi:ParB family chromosome partitioning protein